MSRPFRRTPEEFRCLEEVMVFELGKRSRPAARTNEKEIRKVSKSRHLSSPETVALFQRYVIPNYTRYPVNIVRGEGSRVGDNEGHCDLDL